MTTLTASPEAWRSSQRRNLVRHFFEMVLAMIAGMAVLGAAVRLVCAALGYSDVLQHAGLRAPLMAANMTIGMSVWMRHRGHGWAPIGEMGAAMFVPLLVLLGPFLAGALSGDALSGAMHVLMLPAMVIAMLTVETSTRRTIDITPLRSRLRRPRCNRHRRCSARYAPRCAHASRRELAAGF